MNSGCSEINMKLETMNIYQFKYDMPRGNIQIAEWMNEISIAGETYS